MSSIWKLTSPESWEDAIRQYTTRRAILNIPDLDSLDSWFQSDLPKIIGKRSEKPYISHEDLIRLMTWKLKRGKFRPRLTQLIAALDPSDVQTYSTDAFTALDANPNEDGLRSAITALIKLKGVGPATASAIAAAYAPAVAPFMSDEAMAAVPGIDTGSYTLNTYLTLADALRTRAAELNKCAKTDVWTAQRVENAIWSDAASRMKQRPDKKPAVTKRKRAD